MNLPNYFLADVSPEASLTAAMIGEACRTLKRNREQYLAARSTASLVKALSELGENWLQPDYPFRQMALAPFVQKDGVGILAVEPEHARPAAHIEHGGGTGRWYEVGHDQGCLDFPEDQSGLGEPQSQLEMVSELEPVSWEVLPES